MTRLTEVKEQHVLCRAYGHPWRPMFVATTTNTRGKVIEYRPHLRCDRCTTVKVQSLNTLGEITGTRYIYPEDYLQRSPAEARYGRQEVRQEFLRRVFDDKEKGAWIAQIAHMDERKEKA